jgi:hypothetical protein
MTRTITVTNDSDESLFSFCVRGRVLEQYVAVTGLEHRICRVV